ncbi:DUF1439 domain-containing protein [Microbulbifer marinus]|uniref:DUF1439 domain-containing protein n=1 Tax=Microbulbifer marinus TaxID=658218 RepID=A0A1H3WQY8_9GAMM|nr:DUF1439 domain-containing protein [Microbulbifer marinus]SDZ89566.1 Protein of unknown function [Microbulbifer marinus]
MARVIAVIAAALLALAVAAYLFYSGKEYTVKIPEAEIQQNLAKGLPVSKSYLTIFELTLDNPRVDLVEDSGRIVAGMDVALRIDATDDKRVFRGSVDISGLPHYVPATGEFHLQDLKIDRLSLEGLPDKQTERTRMVIEAALKEYYRRHPIYTLKATDIRQLAARLTLRRVSVEGDDLIIVLGI